MKRFCVGKVGNWGVIDWEEGIYPQMGDKLYSQPLEPLSDEEIWKDIPMRRGSTFVEAKAEDFIRFARAIEERILGK